MTMLWYKSWLDTRWRFLIGLGLLVIVACGTLFDFVATRQLMPLAGSINTTGEIGRRIKEAVELEREYRGFVWLQWFRQNLSQLGTLFAVLLGSGGLLSRASGGGALYMLSLPTSRNQLAGVRAATGLAEFLILVVVPSLILPLASPAIGQHYSVADALVHSGCLFVAGAAFFSLAFLLSTVFGDPWRPLLLACFVAVALAAGEATIQGPSQFGIFHVMSGEVYFRNGQLPWLGLLLSAALSIALLYGATRNLARQDF